MNSFEKINLNLLKNFTENKKLYELLFDTAPIGITITTFDGILLLANKTNEKVTGYKTRELKKINMYDYYIDPGRRENLLSLLKKEGRVRDFEASFKRKDGKIFYALLNADIIGMDHKELILTTTRDITENKQSEEELKKSEERFRLLANNATDIVYKCRIGKKPVFEFLSPSIYKSTGYAADEFFKNPGLIFEIVDKNYIKLITNILNGKFDFSKKALYKLTHKSGAKLWMEDSITPFYDNNGKLIAIEGISRDITERKNTEENLRFISFHDNLTGLYNRAFFGEELKRLDTERQLPLSIIMTDVNGLKLINDAFGHREGDILLCKCAGIFEKCFRKEDIIARWGGDEFVILLPKTSELEGLKIIERIKKECLKSIDQKIPISISMGIATKTDKNTEISLIVNESEEWMYRKKLVESKSISNSIITSLRRVLFEKSIETEEHAKRTTALALKLGKSLGLIENKLSELSLLSTLHDIGKVAISEDILLKKDKLSKHEWINIKKHPQIGHNIAMASPHLSLIADAILSHHEWWDGSGYPHGLKEEEIPIVSRILAIVDAYDVMISGRPYKKKMGKKDVILELKEWSGRQFDPDLVTKFIQIINKNK